MKQIQLYREGALPARALCYVMDPMCSWCWAFRPVVERLTALNELALPLVYVLGGLAPDSDTPMPEPTRTQIEQIWRRITAHTGARFNHDFWRHNTPYRSTYPACRAVIAAEQLAPGQFLSMITAIQHAYYRDARNPSEPGVLSQLAATLGIDPAPFAALLHSDELQDALYAHLRLRDGLQVQGYPALVYWCEGEAVPVSEGYLAFEAVWERLQRRGLLGQEKVRRP